MKREITIVAVLVIAFGTIGCANSRTSIQGRGVTQEIEKPGHQITKYIKKHTVYEVKDKGIFFLNKRECN